MREIADIEKIYTLASSKHEVQVTYIVSIVILWKNIHCLFIGLQSLKCIAYISYLPFLIYNMPLSLKWKYETGNFDNLSYELLRTQRYCTVYSDLIKKHLKFYAISINIFQLHKSYIYVYIHSEMGTNCKTILCIHSSCKYIKRYTAIGTISLLHV